LPACADDWLPPCVRLLLPTACRSDESGITCIWAKVPPGKSRFVTITVNASSAGVQPSIAAVTTASLELDARNNKAAASVSVLVSGGALAR
jgi:hypothetical protein